MEKFKQQTTDNLVKQIDEALQMDCPQGVRVYAEGGISRSFLVNYREGGAYHSVFQKAVVFIAIDPVTKTVACEKGYDLLTNPPSYLAVGHLPTSLPLTLEQADIHKIQKALSTAMDYTSMNKVPTSIHWNKGDCGWDRSSYLYEGEYGHHYYEEADIFIEVMTSGQLFWRKGKDYEREIFPVAQEPKYATKVHHSFSEHDEKEFRKWISNAREDSKKELMSARWSFSTHSGGFGATRNYQEGGGTRNLFDLADIFVNVFADGSLIWVKGEEYREQVFPGSTYTASERQSKSLLDATQGKVRKNYAGMIYADGNPCPATGPIWWQVKDLADAIQKERLIALRNEVRQLLRR